ncbi:hypothetical protein TNCV_4705551 [Trichonephila clavipes]|nr:hypothetical protein TNCV_4705551 [Trichonephila clavipes]
MWPYVKAVTSKCLGGPPVDHDRLNAHPSPRGLLVEIAMSPSHSYKPQTNKCARLKPHSHQGSQRRGNQRLHLGRDEVSDWLSRELDKALGPGPVHPCCNISVVVIRSSRGPGDWSEEGANGGPRHSSKRSQGRRHHQAQEPPLLHDARPPADMEKMMPTLVQWRNVHPRPSRIAGVAQDSREPKYVLGHGAQRPTGAKYAFGHGAQSLTLQRGPNILSYAT